MGLLDEIVGKAAGILGGDKGEQAGLLGGVMEMFAGKESGGMAGLVQSFQEKGLGGVISSWIGTGENLPISADQIQQVMGSDAIQGLAAKFGIPTEELSGKLAEFLPGAIDKMTPNGTLPEEEG
ncbi:MAG: YidB family protein [Geobacteraceae bacterium]